MKEDDVIAWDSHWGHWWIQGLDNAGRNGGHAWLQQDDRDNCPGSEKGLVRAAGSDDVKEEVTITPSSQCM